MAVAARGGTQDARRDEQLQPEKVMDVVGIRPGMLVGEAGAGRGYFTFKLAGRVGASGKVTPTTSTAPVDCLAHSTDDARRWVAW